MASRILCLRWGDDTADYSLRATSHEEVQAIFRSPLPPRGEPVIQFLYFSTAKTAYYIASTATTRVCMVATGIATEELARRLNSRLDFRARMTPAGFQDAVEEITGESVNPGQPKGRYLAKWHRWEWWRNEYAS
jgi:hypothetical protein